MDMSFSFSLINKVDQTNSKERKTEGSEKSRFSFTLCEKGSSGTFLISVLKFRIQKSREENNRRGKYIEKP